MIVKDGEGATKLIEITVEGASSEEDALKAASAIAKSPLVKTAMFGGDANWGRILTAVGYSGAQFDPAKVSISLGKLKVFKNGSAVPFPEDEAKKLLSGDEIKICVNLNNGNFSERMLTCDLSCDYVKINASYRS
jgi:glutamate N-acetyltransferase/amino-acid N-acetyltransferase